jgi:hypothetical protein
MTKCATCGTGWTSAGLPLCPVCGTKVPAAAAAVPEPVLHQNGSAVLEVPPVPMKEEPGVESRLRLLDASAAEVPVQRDLPSPARPLSGPLVLGALAFVPALVLPLAFLYESTRVLGVLGFCMAGFFAPFAPIAWMVGLSAEKRRREQGLRAERRVSIGRLFGQAATLVLVAELTVTLVAIAVLRLSGRFPDTFWNCF